jgi:hypothetical protein
MSEQLQKALAAVQALRSAAIRGDKEAAADLVKIALRSIGHIDSLKSHPEGYPGRTAIDAVATQSESWPVTVRAMKEQQAPRIPELLGAALHVRTNGRRNLDYRKRTGFAKSTLDDMSKRDLPPFNAPNIQVYVDAAMVHLEADCLGDFETYPWPAAIKADADARLGENASMQAALRYVIREWLKYGFSQLVKAKILGD